jgi:hypothetical protein
MDMAFKELNALQSMKTGPETHEAEVDGISKEVSGSESIG